MGFEDSLLVIEETHVAAVMTVFVGNLKISRIFGFHSKMLLVEVAFLGAQSADVPLPRGQGVEVELTGVLGGTVCTPVEEIISRVRDYFQRHFAVAIQRFDNLDRTVERPLVILIVAELIVS